MDTDKILNWATELQSLAQAGLFYGHDKFDFERYQRIREISAEMISAKTDLPLDKVKDLFCGDEGYQTPKIDTRAAIFKDDKILLVREEAGLDAVAEKLIAVHDMAKNNTPRYIFGVIKFFFLCSETGGEFKVNIETIETKYFAENDLPPLAEGKCSAEQIKLCFKARRADFWETVFD